MPCLSGEHLVRLKNYLLHAACTRGVTRLVSVSGSVGPFVERASTFGWNPMQLVCADGVSLRGIRKLSCSGADPSMSSAVLQYCLIPLAGFGCQYYVSRVSLSVLFKTVLILPNTCQDRRVNQYYMNLIG